MNLNSFLISKKFFLFTAILLLGLLVRTIGLSKNPYGFFCDEASIGYNAYKILTTGKDEYEVPFPIFFRAFGEYKSPVNIYSTVPFVAIFGLNEFSVRLFSATYGVLTLVAIYFFSKRMFNEKIALISTLLLAISPWHIHISRIAFENISYLFWLTLSVALFLKGVNKQKWIILSTISFAITAYTYTPARVITPIFFTFLFLLYSKKLFKKNLRRYSFISVLIFMFLLLPLSKALVDNTALSRWNQLTIFSKDLTLKEILSHITTAYINHFSPQFLFTKGDVGFPGQDVLRHSVRGMGELYLFQALLLIAGCLALIKDYKKLKNQTHLLLFWLLVYPVASTLTIDINPQATRGIIGVIPFTIISAFGLYKIIIYTKRVKRVNNAILLTVITIIISLSFTRYILLLKDYPNYSAGYWGFQSGPKEMISYFLEHEQDYDEFYMDGMFNAPYIFLSFYIPDENIRAKSRIGGLDNFDSDKKQLWGVNKNLFCSTSNHNDFLIKSIIYYPNGEVAFYLVENHN